MPGILHTVRSFVTALRMTLRGEALQPPDLRYPRLYTWVETGTALAQKCLQRADARGLDQAQREAITLHLDGRDISMQTILGAVVHNLTLEYPMLMDARVEHNLTTLYALNLNDRYRVMQLAQSEMLAAYPGVQAAVEELSQHLDAIPPSTDLNGESDGVSSGK